MSQDFLRYDTDSDVNDQICPKFGHLTAIPIEDFIRVPNMDPSLKIEGENLPH